MGETSSRLSIRSRIPPCPGNNLPESLTSRVLFIKDSQRSPHVANIDVRIPNAIHPVNVNPVKNDGKHNEKIIAATMQKNNPPKKPSHDFLGDMRSNKRCFPNVQPTQNAPVSLTHMKINKASNICAPKRL